MGDDRVHVCDQIGRIATVEADIKNIRYGQKEQSRVNEEVLGRIFHKMERIHEEVREIKTARQREKGFMAGMIFVVGSLAAGAATVWHYFAGR